MVAGAEYSAPSSANTA
jgi:hypothetical protein